MLPVINIIIESWDKRKEEKAKGNEKGEKPYILDC
jgi:hypothetical protein